jgi:hypothetical protein
MVTQLQTDLWVYWAPATNSVSVEKEMIRLFKEEVGKEPFANTETNRKQARVRHPD